MSKVVIVGERGLLRDLLRQHIEKSESGLLAVEAEPQAILDEPLVAPSVILILGNALERFIEQCRDAYAGVPLCVVVNQVERPVILQLIRLGVHGVVSAQSSMTSLVPVLQLIMSGERFAPFTADQVPEADWDAPHGQSRAPNLSPPQVDVRLTTRERQVAEVLLRGQPNKLIARELGMQENTVKIHVRSVLKKFGARSRSEAIARSVMYRQGPFPSVA